MNMQALKVPAVVGVVAVVILGGGYVMMSQNTAPQGAEEKKEVVVQENVEGIETGATQSGMPVPDASGSGVQEAVAMTTVTVEGENFKFSVPEINVTKGTEVTVKFVNKAGFHDFVLDEFNVKTKQLQAGSTETVTFVADKVGTFEYYCSVGKHRANGMKGNLVVTE